MGFVTAGDIRLHYVEQGKRDNAVIFLHGNLGCVQWLDLVRPLLPDSIHLGALDWRGCGNSDKPEPLEDYSNYSMEQHARDMLHALDDLGIERCGLATHSTGDIIATHMLLMAPERFTRVFSLDPVTPKSLAFDDNSLAFFRAMRDDPAVAYAGLATAAPTLFTAESLEPGKAPEFRPETTRAQRQLYQRLVDRTRVLSDGIWLGTPIQLTREHASGELHRRQAELTQPRLIVWGEQDLWIPREAVEEFAAALPDCRLETVPEAGHSLNVERPEQYARLFRDFFAKR